MTKNEGNTDRIIRAVVAVAAFGAAAAVGFDSGAGIALVVVGAIMAVTAAVGFCPLYRVVGISTCPLDSKAS
jgi:hypothetical protein